MKKHAAKSLILIELTTIQSALRNIVKFKQFIPADSQVCKDLENSKLSGMYSYILKLEKQIKEELL